MPPVQNIAIFLCLCGSSAWLGEHGKFAKAGNLRIERAFERAHLDLERIAGIDEQDIRPA